VANIYSVEEKLPYLLVMFSQSIASLKVPPFAILNLLLVIKVNIQDVLEHTPLLLDILMMEAEPESDYHQVPEKLFQVFAEPQLESLLQEVEMKNQS
jgi:Mn2+/Fe2+ NRAMP family transporter